MTTASRPSHDNRHAYAVPPVTAHPDIACRGADTNLFFPHAGHHPARALAICGRCPHRAECGDWAIDTGQAFGVWGGLTPEDRQLLAQVRRQEAS